MSVDITPRQLQEFLPDPGSKVKFTTSRGASGTLTVDEARRVTAEGVRLLPSESTEVSIVK